MMTSWKFRILLIASPLSIAMVTGVVLIIVIGLQFHLSKHHTTSLKRTVTNAPSGSAIANQLLEHGPDLQEISVVHHGRIIEVKGGTEPGAVVMINGEPAVTFFDGNKFKHFVGPLLPGTSIVTITAQNDRGGVTTRQLAVTID